MTASSDKSDTIRRAQLGDKEAFKELFEALQSLIWRIANDRFHDYDTANDVASVTWTKAWRALPTAPEDYEAFQRWICRIVINECNQVHRRVRKEKGLFEFPGNMVQGHYIYVEVSPDTGVIYSMDITGALEQLPPKHREAIEQRAAGNSVDAIAAASGGPLSTAKAWLRRGRAKLRKTLGDSYGSNPKA